MKRWLIKSVMTPDDIDPDVSPNTQGGILSPEQTNVFLRLAIQATNLVSRCRIEFNRSPKFEVPRISMNTRILRKGTSGSRLNSSKQTKPATGLMEMSTNLFKGEVPIADETFEDQIEREQLAETIATMVAEAVGRDVEELAIKSDTSRDPAGTDVGDADSEDFDMFDGIIKRAQTVFPSGQKIDATTAGIATAEDLFKAMLEAMPARYRNNLGALRYFVPVIVDDIYQAELEQRGTQMGDNALVDGIQLHRFRGIPIVPVPLLSGQTTINGSAVDYAKFAMLTDPMNIVVGYHRRVRLEKYREPREGVTYYLPTVRFDTDWANPESSILASNISLQP